MEYFKPTSLCNTIYKIFAKVMVNHFKPLLEKFISPHQNGFVPRRHILDMVITTDKVIHSMKKYKKLGMALKLYIYKAYDKVNHNFLFSILANFGFNEMVLRIKKNVVTYVPLLVIVNGSPRYFFSLSLGLSR